MRLKLTVKASHGIEKFVGNPWKMLAPGIALSIVIIIDIANRRLDYVMRIMSVG